MASILVAAGSLSARAISGYLVAELRGAEERGTSVGCDFRWMRKVLHKLFGFSRVGYREGGVKYKVGYMWTRFGECCWTGFVGMCVVLVGV